MQDVHELALQVARRLGRVDGIVAVALGGSWARGDAGLDDDIDLVIYYHDDARPSVQDLREVAAELNPNHAVHLVEDYWEQGPLVNGQAWLWVEGRRIDWRYRDLERVGRALSQGRSGSIGCHYQPGYPHGFFSYAFMGEVHYARPLFDPSGVLASLKLRTDPYPEALKLAIIRHFTDEADQVLFGAQRAATNNDILYVAGCLFRCAVCLMHVILAVHEVYFQSERQAQQCLPHLEQTPAGFLETVTDVLAAPGHTPEALQDSIARMRVYVSEVQVAHRKPLTRP